MNLTNEEQQVLNALEESNIKQLSLSDAEQQVNRGFVECLNLEFERRSFWDGCISYMMPIRFNTIALKPANPQLPQVILSDPKSTVMVYLDYNRFDYKNSDVGSSIDQMKLTMKSMNPNTRIYKNGVTTLGKKNLEYLEFFNTNSNGDLFNDFFQLSVQNKNLYCYFTCHTDIARQWRNIFWAIMKSAQF